MKDLETILQDSGVIIQPFWQKLFSHMNPKVKNYGVHRLSRWICKRSGSIRPELTTSGSHDPSSRGCR